MGNLTEKFGVVVAEYLLKRKTPSTAPKYKAADSKQKKLSIKNMSFVEKMQAFLIAEYSAVMVDSRSQDKHAFEITLPNSGFKQYAYLSNGRSNHLKGGKKGVCINHENLPSAAVIMTPYFTKQMNIWLGNRSQLQMHTIKVRQ